MKGHAIIYSTAELQWIEANSKRVRHVAHAEFVDRFNRPDVSMANFNSLCKRNRWLTGRTGQYPKGHAPENKGKKMPFNPNSARTQFKKGNRSGKANENYKPIDTERLSQDGYVERKIHDGMPLQSRWRAVHLVNWEARHGPIPEGHCLKCIDGNKQNTNLSNWELIPRALLPRLAGRWHKPYGEYEPELRPTVLTIAKLEHRAKLAQEGDA